MKKYIGILFFLLAANYGLSQCDNFHTSLRCRPSPQEAKDMILSNQSRSAQLEARKTYQYQITLFGNMDYRLIFCTERRYNPVHYIITEKETGILLYDNKDDDYVESIGFISENTTNVTVDVTILAEGKVFEDFGQDRACLGVTILYRRVPRLGF